MIVDQLYTQPKPTVTSTRIFTEGRHKKLLKEDAVFRQARQFGQLLVEYKLTKAQVEQLFKDVEQGATAAGGNRTGLGKAKDATTDAISSVQKMLASARKWVKERPTYQAVDTEYNKAMTALGKAGGENGEANAITKAIYKYRDAAKNYPRATGLAKWAIITAAGLATGGIGGTGVAAGLAAIDSALKDREIVDIVGDAATAALVSGAVQGAKQLGSMAFDAPLASDAPFMGGQQGYDEAGNFLGGQPGYDEAGNYMPRVSGGDQIGVPGAETGGGGVPDVTAPELATYTVQPGDNLSKIALANNTSVKELQGLNPQLAAASGATGGQSLNPDVIFPGQQITLPPGTPGADVYAGGVGTAADTAAKVASGQYAPNPRSPLRLAETVKYKILPVSQLIDHKLTVMGWALNESTNREMGRSLQLTKLGVRTVFENIGRYRREYLKEYVGAPTADYGHPTAPGAPASATAGQGKPKGWFGRGLDTIGRGVDKVGSWASNVGHNVITKVTADKLSNMWNRAGEPYDSDQLYQLLTTEWGVPQQAVDSVFSKMGIPFTATPGTAMSGGAGIQTGATSLIDPDTGQPYEKRKLAALHNQPAPAPAPAYTPPKGISFDKNNPEHVASMAATTASEIEKNKRDYPTTATTPAPAAPGVAATPAAQPAAPATGKFPGEEPTGPNYVGRLEVKRRQAARAAAASTTPAKPNFAQQGGGYGSVNYAPNIKTGISLPKPTAPVPAASTTKVPTQAQKDAYFKSLDAPAMAETIKQVKKMLETVQTRDDVNFIKKYINHEFDRRGMVNQLATVQRNHLIERVTQIAAGRRRDHARQLAH